MSWPARGMTCVTRSSRCDGISMAAGGREKGGGGVQGAGQLTRIRDECAALRCDGISIAAGERGEWGRGGRGVGQGAGQRPPPDPHTGAPSEGRAAYYIRGQAAYYVRGRAAYCIRGRVAYYIRGRAAYYIRERAARPAEASGSCGAREAAGTPRRLPAVSALPRPSFLRAG